MCGGDGQMRKPSDARRGGLTSEPGLPGSGGLDSSQAGEGLRAGKQCELAGPLRRTGRPW